MIKHRRFVAFYYVVALGTIVGSLGTVMAAYALPPASMEGAVPDASSTSAPVAAPTNPLRSSEATPPAQPDTPVPPTTPTGPSPVTGGGEGGPTFRGWVAPTPTPSPTTGGGEGGPTFVGFGVVPTPSARFTYPFNQSELNGTVQVKVRVEVGSAPTADYVQFYVDGKAASGEISTWGDAQYGKCDVSCFFFLWDTTLVPDGTHVLSARAHYKGKESTVAVTVNVNNASAPKLPPTGTVTPTPSRTGTTSRVGTLSLSSEGNLYILGLGYIGRNNRTIRLNAGTYTVYAVAPSTRKVCWAKRVVITAGKTTTMRMSGLGFPSRDGSLHCR